MKEIKLASISSTLQDFAESLAKVLDLEITIADENFVRIVGTGIFKDKISKLLPVGSVYRSSIAYSKPFVVENASASENCTRCELKKECTVRAETCAPIIMGNKSIGVIGFVAASDLQKECFLRKTTDYYSAIVKLSKLIQKLLILRDPKEKKTSKVPYFLEAVEFDSIIGNSNKIAESIEFAKKIAQTDANVLIIGESGTGKELFSIAIHSASPRRDYVFEAINCSAIPDTLLESELFGYEGGAFTGAIGGGKMGRFQLADNGTVFLDEIDDMPLSLQAKLLRVLENKLINRLGGIAPIQINTRIIAATKRDLKDLVQQKQFREDLYYRLNVISIFVPPLRERDGDVDLLAEFYLRKYNNLYQKVITAIEPKLLKRFREYVWPGNVRELKNIIEYGVIVEKTSILQERTVFHRFEHNGELKNYLSASKPLSQILSEIEKKIVKETLDKFRDDPSSVDKAAKMLGISRATVYRKLRHSQD